MATSYNGYEVIGSYGDPRLTTLEANGKKFAPHKGVLAGDVAVVLNYLADFLDAHVEPMDLPGESDDWAFTPKQVTGGSGWSCHASATAFDYNATRHGQGRHGTWTADQIRKVDAFIRDELQGCVRWGEHWTGSSIDGMHFEIYGSRIALAAVAARIRLKGKPAPAPAPKPTKPVVTPPAVPTPPKPATGAPAFPLPKGFYYGPYSGPNDSISGNGKNDAKYRPGLQKWQAQMKARGHNLVADGFYGNVTRAVALQLQRRYQLAVDGLIGPATWAAAWKK